MTPSSRSRVMGDVVLVGTDDLADHRGLAIASINYRLSDEAIFPAQIHDVKGAVRFLRRRAAEWGLDSTRIGAWGTSAGGHLAALLGTSGGVASLEGSLNPGASSRVSAVVDWFGPTDFLQLDAQLEIQGCTIGLPSNDPRSNVCGSRSGPTSSPGRIRSPTSRRTIPLF